MFLLILLNLLYASTFLFTKIAMSCSQPVFMTGVRMLIGGIISLCIYKQFYYRWTDISSITKKQWVLIGALSFTNVYLCNILEVWGLQYLSVGKAAFFYNLTPFFSALFAYFVFSEYMTWQKWLGLSLGFLGFMPIFMEPGNVVDTTMKIGFFSLADGAMLGAAIISILGWTIMRLLLKQKSFSAFLLNGITMTSGSLLCFLHALCFESQPFVQPGMMYSFIQIALLIAVFKHVIANNLNAYLLTKYTTTLIAFFSFTASLFAALFGILFLGESISVYFIMSVVCVFTGLMIFYQEELRQGYITK